jgi:hypothetical protein
MWHVTYREGANRAAYSTDTWHKARDWLRMMLREIPIKHRPAAALATLTALAPDTGCHLDCGPHHFELIENGLPRC